MSLLTDSMRLYPLSELRLEFFENNNPSHLRSYSYINLSAKLLREADSETQKHVANKIESFMAVTENPLALIVSAAHDHNAILKENKGFFTTNRQQLLRNNYFIFQIADVEHPAEIAQVFESIVKKIDFFCLRAHGAAKEMQFAENYILQSRDIAETFAWLPEKLNDKGIIYLESCSTGSVDAGDFDENIQFSFGKLTKNLPSVKVAAPSKDSHIERFVIESNKFHFFFEGSP